jgi:hypothetical protein
MRRPVGRLSLEGFLVVLALGTLAWNAWGLWSNGSVSVTIDNRSGTTTLIRASDATSRRPLGTFRVEAGARTVIGPIRLDVWWRDISVPEKATGLDKGVRLELLTDRCELLGSQVEGHWGERLTLIGGSGLVDYSTDEPLAVLPTHDAASVAVDDPCRGATPIPVAVVSNEWTSPVVLNGELRVPPCGEMTFRPGELEALPAVEPAPGETTLTADSIAAQGSLWPVAPRSVHIVGNPGEPPWVEDYGGDAFPGGDEISDCAAAASLPSLFDLFGRVRQRRAGRSMTQVTSHAAAK